LYLARGEAVLVETLPCAVPRMAVELPIGSASPSPQYTPLSSTSHFLCCRSLKALKVNTALKSLSSVAPDPIWQLASLGVAAFQEIGLCV